MRSIEQQVGFLSGLQKWGRVLVPVVFLTACAHQPREMPTDFHDFITQEDRDHVFAAEAGDTVGPADTLVVVDMQLGQMLSLAPDHPELDADMATTLRAIRAEVRHAVAAGMPIILVEHTVPDSTHERITELLVDYPHVQRVMKYSNSPFDTLNGADAFLTALRQTRTDIVRLAGINESGCVADMLIDLLAAGFDVRVNESQTADPFLYQHALLGQLVSSIQSPLRIPRQQMWQMVKERRVLWQQRGYAYRRSTSLSPLPQSQ